MYLTAPIELENMRSGAAQTFANSRGGDPGLRMRVAADPGERGLRQTANLEVARRTACFFPPVHERHPMKTIVGPALPDREAAGAELASSAQGRAARFGSRCAGGRAGTGRPDDFRGRADTSFRNED